MTEKYVRVVQKLCSQSDRWVHSMDEISSEEARWTMTFADDIVNCDVSREQMEENLERQRFCFGTKRNEGQQDQDRIHLHQRQWVKRKDKLKGVEDVQMSLGTKGYSLKVM